MDEHPIEGLMKTAMESIKDMVDVNTVIGDPIETIDGSVIIPVSKVSLGFAAGGSEFDTSSEKSKGQNNGQQLPFGGGSGAGVWVQPVGFLVSGNGQVRLIPVDSNVLADRIIDNIPAFMSQIQSMFDKNSDNNQTPQNSYM